MPFEPACWEPFLCNHCKTRQRVYVGDPNDITLPDVEAVRCVNCGRIELTMDKEDFCMTHGLEVDALTEELIAEYGFVETGKLQNG